MSKFTSGRPHAVLGLLFASCIVLIGAYVALSSAADAQVNTEAVVDMHDLQPLNASSSVAMPERAAAAPVVADYAELYKPTVAPTIAPKVVPTLAPTIAPTPAPTVAPTAVPTAAPAMKVYESGIASTYGEGDGFEGNLTACGQVFHTRVVQIAHKSLPCGTKVRVEDMDTGRTVDAEVTDRGPYVAGRIVDLSWGAFQQLDPTGPGLLHVNVYVLDQ